MRRPGPAAPETPGPRPRPGRRREDAREGRARLRQAHQPRQRRRQPRYRRQQAPPARTPPADAIPRQRHTASAPWEWCGQRRRAAAAGADPGSRWPNRGDRAELPHEWYALAPRRIHGLVCRGARPQSPGRGCGASDRPPQLSTGSPSMTPPGFAPSAAGHPGAVGRPESPAPRTVRYRRASGRRTDILSIHYIFFTNTISNASTCAMGHNAVVPHTASVEYPIRRARWAQEYASRSRHDRNIAFARLTIFALAAIVLALALRRSIAAWWLLIPAAAFVMLLRRHDRVIRARAAAARLITFYDRGLARLEDRWAGTGDTGERFLEDQHLYAADLDLFGRGSLFELLSLARTRTGEETLASWLKQPADPVV